jgi:hypothetical protein
MKKTLLFISSVFIFIISGNAQGGFQWAQREGDQSNGRIIATDNAGNSYVYGGIYATTTIGGQTLDIANGVNFIVKYNNTGSPVWVKQLDSMDVSDLDCSSTDLYVTGRYHPGASFGGTAVTGGSGWDGYIARVNASGSLTWMMTVTNTATYESVNSVTIDNSGNIYVTGTYSGTMAMIGSTTLTGPGWESMFLLKIAPGGTVTWSDVATANSGGNVSGNRIEVSSSGDLYVVSSTGGDTVHYDSFPYFAGSYDAELLLRYNNAGTVLGMAEVNHNSQDNVTSMTVDASGNVYTLQTNYLTSFDLNKYSPSLDTLWMITDGTGGHLSVRDVEVTQSGEIIVAGDVGEDATFGGTTTVYDNGGGNGFLAFYTNTGNYISLEEITGSVFMGSAGLDANDNVYLTGNLNDSASFDAINLTTNSVEAMFLAKYNLATGITSIQENSFLAYPNPCSDILNCTLKPSFGTADVTIYNVLGRKVYERETEPGLLQINLSEYKSGIYLLNIKNNNSTITRKIIVQ